MDLLLATWITEFIGRLHPLMVHFPIGLLVGAFLLEVWSFIRKDNRLRPGIDACILLGAFTAVIAAVQGWLLQVNGAYEGTIVENHKVAGLITTGLAVLAAVGRFSRLRDIKMLPFASLFVAVASLTVAGHLGAGLTHGATYLTEVLPGNKLLDDDSDYTAQLATFTAFARKDSFPSDQLDRLNLEVRAIFAHNCYQCHSIEKRKGDLALDHEEGVMAGGENGPILIAGDGANSEIIRRLKLPRAHDEAMPPKGKVLQPAEIDLIQLWIDQGAHWADSAFKVFREAPLALHQPALPKASKDIFHPIDRWVDTYFQQQEIDWPTPIDDRTFIRRVYLDVIGLLPTPKATETFIADTDPDKRDKLVAKLLDWPHEYAQHWLSFWNDLLRNDYSGTGFITGGRKQITDWLYQALLYNKPYNQFVGELVNPSPASEGFIKGIKWRGDVNSSQTTEMQAAQNISQTLMGINLKCASCHNSFVNNLTLDQAYGMANIFSDSTLEIYRCDKPTGRMSQTAFVYDELGTLEGESVSQRLAQLEKLMTTTQNGRVYRTVVNRYWDKFLGRGIVAPVDEMDNLPWSQELLDWLASDFIAHEYDLKYLIQTILTSKTYQLPSVVYSSPEYLRSQQFVFRGPTPRRLSAEQFADVLSQTLSPVYHAVAYDPTGRDMPAEWIWHREIELDRDVLPKPGKRYFRHTFALDTQQPIQSAELLIAVDHAFSLFLNGNPVGEGNNWRKVHRMEVKNMLQPENILAITGENDGKIPNPAGVLLSLRIIYQDSTVQHIFSDGSWKSTDQLPKGEWKTFTYDDTDWHEVRRYGRFDKSHWGKLLDFTHHPDKDTMLTFARASLVQTDPFQKALGRPSRENVATQRAGQATLLQALELTNGEFFHQILENGAGSWHKTYEGDVEKMVSALYQCMLGRPASRKELTTFRTTLGDNPTQDDVQDALWAIVLLPEFQFIF